MWYCVQPVGTYVFDHRTVKRAKKVGGVTGCVPTMPQKFKDKDLIGLNIIDRGRTRKADSHCGNSVATGVTRSLQIN